MENRGPRSRWQSFVGREAELSALRGALDAAVQGRGGVYLLRGEAGIGKTRTAREVVDAARARGFAVGIGHCLEGDGAAAYAPWVQALQGTSTGDALATRLGSSGGAERDAEERERDQLFLRVETSLREEAGRRPQLLWLEDVHWADVDSIRLLDHLARRLEGWPGSPCAPSARTRPRGIGASAP